MTHLVDCINGVVSVLKISISNTWRLSPGYINTKILCAHHQQEEVLRIPKHPKLVKFG